MRVSAHILHVSESVFTLQVLNIKLSPVYHLRLFHLKARDLDMTQFKSGDSIATKTFSAPTKQTNPYLLIVLFRLQVRFLQVVANG